jgi:hypothetical protein
MEPSIYNALLSHHHDVLIHMLSNIRSTFFKVTAPPPPLPLLSAHTDLFYATPPFTLISQEEIPQRAGTSKHLGQRQNESNSNTVNPLYYDNDGAPDEDSSMDSETDCIMGSEVENDEDNLIAKPPGEAGRPGRGGYNLQEALNWTPASYKTLKV